MEKDVSFLILANDSITKIAKINNFLNLIALNSKYQITFDL